MHAADNLFKGRYAWFDESLFNIAANISWRRAVKREITTLGADDYFIAGETLCFGQVAQSRADRTFASLKTVVCGSIDYIGAKLDRANKRGGVAGISLIISIAQIGANTHR